MFNRVLTGISAILCVAQAAELPVREVILFKHGVGFFSRAGELKAGEAARLDFKASDMNDVLKSLTVEEKGGGKIFGLRYDSSEPLDKKLAQFPFGIGEHFALNALLDQMKGARIEMKYGNNPVTGQIVSGRETSDATNHSKEQLVVLLDSGEMRTLDLGAASELRFVDSVVQRQFVDYLRVVAQARSKEKRSVYLDSTSTSARALVANYMIPSPVWKSSYRLVYGAGTAATLEGWAIVDNTTDEDWSNVRLSLVSGRPISFISQLYEPKYRQRQTVQLAEEDSVAPIVYEGAVTGGIPGGSAGGVIGGIIGGVPGVAAYGGRGQGSSEVGGGEYHKSGSNSRTLVTDSTVSVSTEGMERGDLFEYRFDTLVTVKRSESAMLPFLQQKITSRKLLIYQNRLGPNPRSAAEISNSTGKTLDGGPITVYDAGAYAGEALVETLKAGDKRLISYAVDLGTRVTTKIDSGDVRQVTAKRGVVRSRISIEATNTYTIRNVDPRAKTLVIEHPLRDGFKLLNVKPVETTTQAYRFEVKLDPRATTTFVVKEEALYEDAQAASSLTPSLIESYISGRPLSESAKRQLTAIGDRKQQLVEIDQQVRSMESEMSEVSRDQTRLRENIASLNVVSGQQEQVQRYSRQLAEGETKLVGLRDQQRDARKRKQALESEVADLISKLEF